jgi:hypothetical protein
MLTLGPGTRSLTAVTLEVPSLATYWCSLRLPDYESCQVPGPLVAKSQSSVPPTRVSRATSLQLLKPEAIGP